MLCQVFWTLIVDFLPPSWNTFAAKRFARTQCTPGRKKLELSLLRIFAQQGAAVGAAKASNGDVVRGSSRVPASRTSSWEAMVAKSNTGAAGEGKFRPEKFSKIAKHKVGANVHIRTFPQDVQLKSGKKVFFKFNFLTAFFHQIGMTDKSDAHYIGVFLK